MKQSCRLKRHGILPRLRQSRMRLKKSSMLKPCQPLFGCSSVRRPHSRRSHIMSWKHCRAQCRSLCLRLAVGSIDPVVSLLFLLVCDLPFEMNKLTTVSVSLYSLFFRLRIVDNPDNSSLLGNVAWTISNLCRGPPDFALISCIISGMKDALVHEKCSIMAQLGALRTLSLLSDPQVDGWLARVIPCAMTAAESDINENMDSVKRRSLNMFLVVRALEIRGDIASGNDEETHLVLNAGICPRLATHKPLTLDCS